MDIELRTIREKVLANHSLDSIRAEHPDLAKKKHFFDMIVKKDADDEILNTLGVLLQGIKDDTFTEEYASVKFGELLVEKYVKDKVAR